MDIVFEKLTPDTWSLASLDHFVRHQVYHESWRRVDGRLVLEPDELVRDWDGARRRSIAQVMLEMLTDGAVAFGARCEGEIVGFIFLLPTPQGSSGQYLPVNMFHVSEPFRRHGIGRQLFSLACDAARELGAEKLYISANPSKASQAFYRHLGCVDASEIDRETAAREPLAIPLEFAL